MNFTLPYEKYIGKFLNFVSTWQHFIVGIAKTDEEFIYFETLFYNLDDANAGEVHPATYQYGPSGRFEWVSRDSQLVGPTEKDYHQIIFAAFLSDYKLP
jgi:hypothetical protein